MNSTTRFIPATVRDNPFVNQEYHLSLEALPPWQRKAWLEGDWDIQAGQYFSAWRTSAHVLPSFDETNAASWRASLDYGYITPTVFLLACVDKQGRTIVVDQHSQRLWLPGRHIQNIAHMLSRHGLTPRDLGPIPVGGGFLMRQQLALAPSAAYKAAGFQLVPARVDRIEGWAALLEALGDPANGQPPKLFIHARCKGLISALPAMQHDPAAPEDVLRVDADEEGQQGDDPVDALRYLIATPRLTFGAALA